MLRTMGLAAQPPSGLAAQAAQAPSGLAALWAAAHLTWLLEWQEGVGAVATTFGFPKIAARHAATFNEAAAR